MITVCGEKKGTEDLRDIAVIRPERAGDRWQGISHYDLARNVEDSLQSRDIEIISEAWSTDKSGQSLVGGLNVVFPESLGIPHLQGMDYSLGIRHANNMKYAITFAVGTQILVCCNGMISGQFVLCKKHTSGLDLGAEVDNGIERFVREARNVEGCINELKSRRFTERQSDHLLMQAGRDRLLPWSHIGMVQKEYENPTYQEFKERTGWGIYNAFTLIAQKSAPEQQMKALDRFRGIILN